MLANYANDVSEMRQQEATTCSARTTYQTKTGDFVVLHCYSLWMHQLQTWRHVEVAGNVILPDKPRQGLFLRAALLLLPPSQTYPGRGDVHHNLLEGGCLLGLSLGMQCYLLAKLSGVGCPGPGARDGSGSGSTAACTRRRHLHRADGTTWRSGTILTREVWVREELSLRIYFWRPQMLALRDYVSILYYNFKTNDAGITEED